MLLTWFKVLNIMKSQTTNDTKGSNYMKQQVNWVKELAKVGIKPGVVYVGSKTMTPKEAASHVRIVNRTAKR